MNELTNFANPVAKPETFDEIKIGAGIGARYHTSFGPIRVDIATPVKRRPGEPLRHHDAFRRREMRELRVVTAGSCCLQPLPAAGYRHKEPGWFPLQCLLR